MNAHESGGFIMRDDEGLIPKSIKEMLGKFATKILKGQIMDLSTTPSPAYLHHYVS